MPQYVMTETSATGFQPTRKMESFAGPWPTPPMRRLLRAQRRQEGWHVPPPLPSQKPGSRFIQTAAPDEASSTRLSSSRKPADGGNGSGHDKRQYRLAKMDPARSNINANNNNTNIIGSACAALISSVGKTVADVTNFIRRCRSARADLAAVTRELSELQMVLELLNDYGHCNEGTNSDNDKRKDVPLTLQAHLRPILTNCTTVVLRIDGVLRRHGEDDGPPRWTLEGRKEINDLHNSLVVHRGALGCVSDLISITIAREAGNEDTREPQGEQLQLPDVIEDLQTVLSSILVSDSNATLARQHFALQVHLGQIIAYAQTLDKADAWEEAVKAIDATQGETHTGALEPPPEPVSPIASSRGRRSFDSDGTVEDHDGSRKGFEPVSPMESREAVGVDKREDTTLTVSRKESRKVPRLSIPGSSTNTTSAPVKDPDPDSPMTYREPTAIKRPIDKLKLAEHDLDAISPLTLGKPLSMKAVEERPTTTETAVIDPKENGSSNMAVSDDSIAPVLSRQQSGVAASQASTAESKYEEEEITEEALAFAQVPVHILGRLSLNLVGHVYTNKSGLSGGSDGTSFNRSISTTETVEEMEEAEAEGYAHSTATSDTGSLRDGHLQFSQMDVTQLPAQEPPPPSEKSHDIQQPAEPQQPPTSHQMMHQEPSHEIREQESMSTMNTQNFLHGKPLPRPLAFIPNYPGPCIRKKVVVVGNFSCGKTCLITRMTRGHYPKGKSDHSKITESVKVCVDDDPVDLSLWDIRGIDYDPSWLSDAQVALVCFSVNIGSTDAKGKHLGRWVTEVNRNCPTAAILLVGLKSDIRWHARTVEKLRKHGKTLVTPEQGEQLRESIGAVRYLECSARTGDGVLQLLEETTRIALQVRNEDVNKKGHRRPLSRIGKFLGLGSRESDSPYG